MIKLNNLSLKTQFFLSIISMISFVLFAGFSYNIFSAYSYKKESFIQESELQAGLIADSAIAPIMFFDKEGLTNSLSQLYRYKNIQKVIIYLNDDSVFASFSRDKKNVNFPAYFKGKEVTQLFLKDAKEANSLFSDVFVLKQEIKFNNNVEGTLYLQKSTASLTGFIKSALINLVLFSILMFIFVVYLIYRISKKLIDPVVVLSDQLTKVSKSQDYSTRLYYKANNEIGHLYSSFNALFHSIEVHQKSRDEALAQAKSYQEHLENLTQELESRVAERTKELENSINTLKRAQNQLIESEKMAALGSLVSGVAHEVNTPLGNAVTGGSIIKKETEELIKSMQDGTLKKSTLEESLKHIDETSKLLYRSLNTAAELIKSFKQISVDQSVERKRSFDLVEYVNEIIKTFNNKLKRVPIEVQIIAPKELVLDSYPGAFAQLLNNFIQNSIIHGFEEKRDNARIQIEIYLKDKTLNFIYSDNGAGMSPDIKVKAFDPFVTTKRNAGGTGLGLNIVYNIVTQKLKGTLVLETAPNQGVEYLIQIPI